MAEVGSKSEVFHSSFIISNREDGEANTALISANNNNFISGEVLSKNTGGSVRRIKQVSIESNRTETTTDASTKASSTSSDDHHHAAAIGDTLLDKNNIKNIDEGDCRRGKVALVREESFTMAELDSSIHKTGQHQGDERPTIEPLPDSNNNNNNNNNNNRGNSNESEVHASLRYYQVEKNNDLMSNRYVTPKTKVFPSNRVYCAINSLENSILSGQNNIHHLSSFRSPLGSGEFTVMGSVNSNITNITPPSKLLTLQSPDDSSSTVNRNHTFLQHPQHREHFLQDNPHISSGSLNQTSTSTESKKDDSLMLFDPVSPQRLLDDATERTGSSALLKLLQSQQKEVAAGTSKVREEVKKEGEEKVDSFISNSEIIVLPDTEFKERTDNLQSRVAQVAVAPEEESNPSTKGTSSAPLAVITLPSAKETNTSILRSKNGTDIKSQIKGKKVSLGPDVKETFRPSCDAYTPRVNAKKITYKPAPERQQWSEAIPTMGTLQRPNFRDALRRVAMIIQQHIMKIERRYNSKEFGNSKYDIFRKDMYEAFSEDNFLSPRYRCTMVRVPITRAGVICSMKQLNPTYKIPNADEIYDFAHQLFQTVQLSNECSIVSLIYIERLMEVAKVPLMAKTWRPIVMCGLLLASKVWQDLSSWNIEFAAVYPQYSLDSINKLELLFLRKLHWDMYISSSLYAKYYFALRSLLEKKNFRQNYNRMIGVGVDMQGDAARIQKRSEKVKVDSINQLSRSM